MSHSIREIIFQRSRGTKVQMLSLDANHDEAYEVKVVYANVTFYYSIMELSTCRLIFFDLQSKLFKEECEQTSFFADCLKLLSSFLFYLNNPMSDSGCKALSEVKLIKIIYSSKNQRCSIYEYVVCVCVYLCMYV